MDVEKFLSAIKVPKMFREVITLIGGFGFLFILWFFKIRYLNLDLNLSLGRIEIDFIIIVTAYLTGRTLLFLSDIFNLIENFVCYFANKERSDLKTSWLGMVDFINYRYVINKPLFPDRLQNDITSGEIWESLSKYQLMEEALERDHQSRMFTKFFIIYLIIFLFYSESVQLSLILWVFIVYFFVQHFIKNRIIHMTFYELNKHIAKNRGKKP